MSAMIVFKVITVLLLIEVLMSGVISQSTVDSSSTFDSSQTGADYGEYDDSSELTTQSPTALPTEPTTEPPLDCTNVNNPPTKDVFKKECQPGFCDCLDPQKGCPPHWSRSFVDGLYNKYNIWGFPYCTVQGQKLYITFKPDKTMIQIRWQPQPWASVYLTQLANLGRPKEPSKGEVRYPDTYHLWDMYLNTTYFGPDINAKEMWYLRTINFNPEIIDSKITSLRKDYSMLYWPSYYEMSDPTDPLFDSYIFGPMHKRYKSWYQLDRYVPHNHSNKVELQAISLDDKYDMKFNPMPKLLWFQKRMVYCIGSKVDPQSGRWYWTAEGCRPTIKFGSYKSVTDIGFDHDIMCECDFQSTGLKKPEPTPTTTEKPALELVDGFNLPEGIRKPRMSISGSRSAFWSTLFGSLIFVLNVILFVAAIGIGVYFFTLK